MMQLSIVSVVYNDRLGLMRTIASIDRFVARDSIEYPIEHVIIDGASNDGTLLYLDGLKDSRPLPSFILSEPDFGIYDAMNKGVKYSRGKVLVFLNAGDEVDSRCSVDELLTDIAASFERSNEAGFVYRAIMKIGTKTVQIRPREVDPKMPRMPGIHQSMFFKRTTLVSIPFDTSFKICGDYDNFASIFNKFGCFKPIDRYFSVFYAGGISSQLPLTLMRESYRVSMMRFELGFFNRLVVIARLILSLITMQSILLFERIVRKI